MLFLKVKRDQLLAPLLAVSGIVERRHTLPILSNILVERASGQITFLATDIEIQIRTRTSVDGEGEDGAITVSARKLQDILRSLPDGADVSLDVDDKRIQVKAGKSRFSLQTLPSADFPRMTVSRDGVTRFEMPQRDLKKLLSQTQYAMAAQDVRYYLNGLLLIVDQSEMKGVATDGHRLAYASVPLAETVTHLEVILPRKTVLELSRLLTDSDHPVTVELAGNQARFVFADIELMSKLIDGKFPDYTRVIPAATRNVLVLNRGLLQQAMNRVAILTNEKFRGVRLLLERGKLKMNAANAEQEEALEELEVSYEGESLDIGFNVGYLLDVLGNTGAEEICWGFNDSNSSALLTIPDNGSFKYVVMPMRI